MIIIIIRQGGLVFLFGALRVAILVLSLVDDTDIRRAPSRSDRRGRAATKGAEEPREELEPVVACSGVVVVILVVVAGGVIAVIVVGVLAVGFACGGLGSDVVLGGCGREVVGQPSITPTVVNILRRGFVAVCGASTTRSSRTARTTGRRMTGTPGTTRVDARMVA